MEMAYYILEIFKHYISIVWSWGFHDAVALKKGLRFSVQGFLHTGQVEVLYEEGTDLFVVRTINPDGSVKETREGIYLDGLVDAIDRMVEHCPDYERHVRQTYGL